MKNKEILELPIVDCDIDDTTIKGYLHALLKTLWNEGEGFSGKRPFGNSGWECDLYAPLVKAGVIDGKIDDDGCLDYVDDFRGNIVIFELIAECFE